MIWVTVFQEWHRCNWGSVLPASAWLHPSMLELFHAGLQQDWSPGIHQHVFDLPLCAVFAGGISPAAHQQLRAALGLQPVSHTHVHTAEVLQQVRSPLQVPARPCCMHGVLHW
jgi:hypothetical protein